jgi:hypothetical protein
MNEVSVVIWIAIVAVAALALGVMSIAWWSPARRYERALRKTLRHIGEDTLTDLVIPDGVEGEIQIDLVVLTVHGLLVLEIKRVEGTVFGGARVDSWTALTPQSRVAFNNPLDLLNRRVIALRTLLRDNVPVNGRVVFVGDVSLGADLPSSVTTPASLATDFARPDARSKAPLSAYYPHWDQLRRQTAA